MDYKDFLNSKKKKGRRFKIKKEVCENCGWLKDLEIHHIKPKCEGGTNNPKNYMILCKRCHLKIHRKKIVVEEIFLDIRKNIMRKKQERE